MEYGETVCKLHYRKRDREGAGHAERGQVDPCVVSMITERLSLVSNISTCRLADQIEDRYQLANYVKPISGPFTLLASRTALVYHDGAVRCITRVTKGTKASSIFKLILRTVPPSKYIGFVNNRHITQTQGASGRQWIEQRRSSNFPDQLPIESAAPESNVPSTRKFAPRFLASCYSRLLTCFDRLC